VSSFLCPGHARVPRSIHFSHYCIYSFSFVKYLFRKLPRVSDFHLTNFRQKIMSFAKFATIAIKDGLTLGARAASTKKTPLASRIGRYKLKFKVHPDLIERRKHPRIFSIGPHLTDDRSVTWPLNGSEAASNLVSLLSMR